MAVNMAIDSIRKSGEANQNEQIHLLTVGFEDVYGKHGKF